MGRKTHLYLRTVDGELREAQLTAVEAELDAAVVRAFVCGGEEQAGRLGRAEAKPPVLGLAARRRE